MVTRCHGNGSPLCMKIEPMYKEGTIKESSLKSINLLFEKCNPGCTAGQTVEPRFLQLRLPERKDLSRKRRSNILSFGI